MIRECKKCGEQKPLKDFPDYKMPIKGGSPVYMKRTSRRRS